MGSHVRFGSLIISLAIGGILSGCFSSTKEVKRPRACPCGASRPPVVQLPGPVVVAPASDASQTNTSTRWGNGRGDEEDYQICRRSGTKPDYDYWAMERHRPKQQRRLLLVRRHSSEGWKQQTYPME